MKKPRLHRRQRKREKKMERAAARRRRGFIFGHSALLFLHIVGVVGCGILATASAYWIEPLQLSMPFLDSIGFWFACLRPSDQPDSGSSRTSTSSASSFFNAIEASFQRKCINDSANTIDAATVFADVYSNDIRKEVITVTVLCFAFVWLGLVKAAGIATFALSSNYNACEHCSNTLHSTKKQITGVTSTIGVLETCCGIVGVTIFLQRVRKSMNSSPDFAEGSGDLRNIFSSGFYLFCASSGVSLLTSIAVSRIDLGHARRTN